MSNRLAGSVSRVGPGTPHNMHCSSIVAVMAVTCGLLLASFAKGAELREEPIDEEVARQALVAKLKARARDAGTDYVPVAALSESERNKLPSWCQGVYVDPSPAPERPREEAPLYAEADAVHYELDVQAQLDGNVFVQREDQRVMSESALFDERSGVVTLDGEVTLREPGLLLVGTQAQVDLRNDTAEIKDARFLIHEDSVRGDAKTLSRRSDNSVLAQLSSLTTCPPENNSWTIMASEFELDQEAGVGKARHARLRFGGVPVLYTPYLRFPLGDERQSGFLFPNIGFNSDTGLDLGAPYYFNLAPNYDATLTPRIALDRGAILEGEFRHLSGKTSNEMRFGYMPEDDEYDGTLSRDNFEELLLQQRALGADPATLPNASDFNPADRWYVNWQHRGSYGPVRGYVNFTDLSDDDYLRDFGNDLEDSSEAQVERIASFAYDVDSAARQDSLSVRLWAQSFRRLDETIAGYERLPQLDVVYGRKTGPLETSLTASVASFDRDTSRISGFNEIIGQRLHFTPRVELPFRWPFAFLRAQGGFHYTRYWLDNTPNGLDDDPARDIGFGSLDGGLFFERPLTLFGRGFTQTLEPRLYYLYVDFEDQGDLPRFDTSRYSFTYDQVFRENRFTGVDRIADANQLSFGLQTRLLNARGVELISAGIAQIHHFRDRRVALGRTVTADERTDASPLAAEMSIRFSDHVRLRSTMIYDHHGGETEQARVKLSYVKNRTVINLGYQNRAPNVDQSDISMALPVSKHFSVVGRWNYDLENTRLIEWFAGVQYDDCCWRVRFLHRLELEVPANTNIRDRQRGFFIQIVLKGMAGVGEKVDRILNRGIPGYNDELF